MSQLTALIIDDEQDSVDLLALQLRKHCPQVGQVHLYTCPKKALQDIELLKPDLLFLDIEMPEINGFQLLEKLMPLHFSVIFVTAYNQYAIKAFRFNALDYLVKPVNSDDLAAAVAKVPKTGHPNEMQLRLLQRQIDGEAIQKIAVTTQNGISFITLSDIVFIEASSNYSVFVLLDGTRYVITKTLKNIQEMLEEKHFFRIHRQYIINLNRIRHFNRTECVVTMDNKAELPVARIQKDKLIDKFDIL